MVCGEAPSKTHRSQKQYLCLQWQPLRCGPLPVPGCQAAEGEENARQAIALGRPLFANNKGVESSIYFSLATSLIGAGRLDEADVALARVSVPALSQTFTDPEWDIDYAMTKAELALRRRDYLTASKVLKAATPACQRPGVTPYRKTWCSQISEELSSKHRPVT